MTTRVPQSVFDTSVHWAQQPAFSREKKPDFLQRNNRQQF